MPLRPGSLHRSARLPREDPISDVDAAPVDPAEPAEPVAEDAPLLAARHRAEEVGCTPVAPATGEALQLLAAVLDARTVVEVGTGTGVSGTWLLRGMAPDGVLTSVDVEPEHQRLARTTFTEAGFRSNRFRLISGRGLDVLPRLTDGHYDLVVLDGVRAEYDAYLAEALRLLRPGGVVAADGVYLGGRVAAVDSGELEPDPETAAVRATLAGVREDERLVSTVLPVGDGLLVATLVG